MLLTIFSPIQKRLCKLLKYQEVKTDNFIFRLHCILTVAVLIGSSLILTTAQLVGNPIQCITGITATNEKTKDWAKAIETYCWVKSTFKVPPVKGQWRHYSRIGESMAYPGVKNEFESGNDGEREYYTYYQWVCFVLFLQGLLCYVPKLLWDLYEGGLLTKLTTGLHGVCVTDDRGKRTDNILCYLLRYRKEHKGYALVYWCCEVLCLANLLLQMWMMNAFLGGHFLSYGVKALQYSDTPQYERNDTLIYIFPRVTKCRFYQYGPSGSIMNLDNMCILPQNVINEKIYIILWFWYIALALMFIVIVIYRVILVAMPSLRPRLLLARSRVITMEEATEVSSRLDLGDWWLLYMLAKNIDPLAYRDLITDFITRESKKTLLN